MSTYYHMSVTPRYLFAKTDVELLACVKGQTDAKIVREQLRLDAARGRVYPIGDCSNQNSDGSCAGHRERTAK
jgi:hypothetical protein